jgi:hypothetical protein
LLERRKIAPRKIIDVTGRAEFGNRHFHRPLFAG